MSSEWKPDDSTIEGKPGAKRVRDALRRHGITVRKGRVITSRDLKMDEARHTLRRENLPPGFQQWQLPVQLNNCPVFFFLCVTQPGAVVPRHQHTRDLFRVVVSGSIHHNGIELKSGDWMFVPAGTPYSYSAGLNPGATTLHCYG